VTAELRDQVALVTGASRGIGRAVALRLARDGCRVVAVARHAAELQATADQAAIFAQAGAVLTLVADVTDDAQLAEVIRRATAEVGDVDVLVNNAGFAPARASVLKTPLADWDRTLATCLRAPMVLTRLVLPGMVARRRGAIVNIASVAARTARAGEAAYAAAKHGLLGFTHALFEEVRGHGVKVIAILPGLVDTAFIPANKRVARDAFLQPDDVADAIHHVLTAAPRACPREIVLEPQLDPEA
jgi:NADP-dependent 3-hydroxy acid dehydrogenase YdfG